MRISTSLLNGFALTWVYRDLPVDATGRVQVVNRLLYVFKQVLRVIADIIFQQKLQQAMHTSTLTHPPQEPHPLTDIFMDYIPASGVYLADVSIEGVATPDCLCDIPGSRQHRGWPRAERTCPGTG